VSWAVSWRRNARSPTPPGPARPSNLLSQHPTTTLKEIPRE
jgi:hypothetical protein